MSEVKILSYPLNILKIVSCEAPFIAVKFFLTLFGTTTFSMSISVKYIVY